MIQKSNFKIKKALQFIIRFPDMGTLPAWLVLCVGNPPCPNGIFSYKFSNDSVVVVCFYKLLNKQPCCYWFHAIKRTWCYCCGWNNGFDIIYIHIPELSNWFGCASFCCNNIIRKWFNIKRSSYQYRKSNCGDKTILWSSYLHNGISYGDKIFSYWIGALSIVDCCNSPISLMAVHWQWDNARNVESICINPQQNTSKCKPYSFFSGYTVIPFHRIKAFSPR